MRRTLTFAVLALVVATLGGCDRSRPAAGPSATTSTSPSVPSAPVPTTAGVPLRLFRPADADAVAVVDRFVRAYNAGHRQLASFWDFSGATSLRWADNPWDRPNRLATDDVPGADITRVGQVLEIGRFQPKDLLGQRRAPVLVAFQVNFGGFLTTWVLELTRDGQHVTNLWIP